MRQGGRTFFNARNDVQFISFVPRRLEAQHWTQEFISLLICLLDAGFLPGLLFNPED
jgi:hypothetical protein